MSEMALETIAKIFLVLVVLSLSIALIGKFYSDVTRINLADEDKEGQQTIGPLESTTSDALGALAANCYNKYSKEAARARESVCYLVLSKEKTFEQMGVTSDGIQAASGLNSSRLEVKSLSSDKLVILYELQDDRVVIR